ncbi:hypothetical protein C7444_10666 [Sphaerotilus hippei]|uniref:DUF2946 family protein n=1 Tax=Sphaerotilus hippei TaxID=744406 RepID=A0A318H0T3_9BURK|nr:DUF2946 family protein [Sphaerotilus hippei]PXW96548.1 hypothetical protein C7444_10666 [Sphaerotilus hippei]
MDDLVRAAMAKWPNVPACHGWLALDARGDWYMRDDRTQQAGPFPQVKGSRIEHAKLIGFIQRNYQADGQGRWFFQNGPQQVFVELEAAPLVLGVERETGAAGGWAVTAHTGQPVREVREALLDESGRLYLQTELGLGLVRSMDMAVAVEPVEQGLWAPLEVTRAGLPRRAGFVLSPQQALAGPAP